MRVVFKTDSNPFRRIITANLPQLATPVILIFTYRRNMMQIVMYKDLLVVGAKKLMATYHDSIVVLNVVRQ